MVITEKKGFSLKDLFHRKAMEWVDARNTRHKAKWQAEYDGKLAAQEAAWIAELASMSAQRSDIEELRKARREAILHGRLKLHACGLYIDSWYGQSTTGQDLLHWYREMGATNEEILQRFEEEDRRVEELRIAIQQNAYGSHFPGWKPEQIDWDSIPEDENDYSKFNGGKPLWK